MHTSSKTASKSKLLIFNKKNFFQVTVKVSVYYESDCPSCRKFFKDQLVPTWKLFRRFIDLDLVPYGKASVSIKCKVVCVTILFTIIFHFYIISHQHIGVVPIKLRI